MGRLSLTEKIWKGVDGEKERVAHHGRLQQDALEQDLVVGQVLEGLGPDLLGNLSCAVNSVLSVKEHLRLNYRDQSAGLYDTWDSDL